VVDPDDDVDLASARVGVVGIDGAERQDNLVRETQDLRPAVFTGEAPEARGFEADRGGGAPQVIGCTSVEVDPQQPVIADPDIVAIEVDDPIVSLRVVEDGADRHRMKARIPAAIAATNAMAHSTRRIERSSTSVSAGATVVWRIIDTTPVVQSV
jgi:hypothetical protein